MEFLTDTPHSKVRTKNEKLDRRLHELAFAFTYLEKDLKERGHERESENFSTRFKALTQSMLKHNFDLSVAENRAKALQSQQMGGGEAQLSLVSELVRIQQKLDEERKRLFVLHNDIYHSYHMKQIPSDIPMRHVRNAALNIREIDETVGGAIATLRKRSGQ